MKIPIFQPILIQGKLLSQSELKKLAPDASRLIRTAADPVKQLRVLLKDRGIPEDLQAPALRELAEFVKKSHPDDADSKRLQNAVKQLEIEFILTYINDPSDPVDSTVLRLLNAGMTSPEEISQAMEDAYPVNCPDDSFVN
jgi:hypothetical protein